jgi:hypothetical protein
LIQRRYPLSKDTTMTPSPDIPTTSTKIKLTILPNDHGPDTPGRLLLLSFALPSAAPAKPPPASSSQSPSSAQPRSSPANEHLSIPLLHSSSAAQSTFPDCPQQRCHACGAAPSSNRPTSVPAAAFSPLSRTHGDQQRLSPESCCAARHIALGRKHALVRLRH